jgi:hypothetical protein
MHFICVRYARQGMAAQGESEMVYWPSPINGFGILWGYGTKDELEASGAHALIKTPRDLVIVFNGKSDLLL